MKIVLVIVLLGLIACKVSVSESEQFRSQEMRKKKTMSKTQMALKRKRKQDEDNSAPKYVSPDIFDLNTLQNLRWKETIDEDGTIRLSYISTSDPNPVKAVRRYKIYCADKYQHHDIGAYMKGGVENCKCDSYFFPPSTYHEVQQYIQKDNNGDFRMKNQIQFPIRKFEVFQKMYAESKMPDSPMLGPWRHKRKCYISFDKASIIAEGDEEIKQTYGYPYDQLKRSKVLKGKNDFLIWMDSVDNEGNNLGLIYAKKLELDIQKFNCDSKCQIQDNWLYSNVKEKILKMNEQEYENIKKIGTQINKDHKDDILKFWKSHQAVLVLSEYCLKLNKVLKLNEVNRGVTLVDINPQFYNVGNYNIINLDVKNLDDPEYRYIIQVDRRCILRKFFGKTYPE